MIALIPPEPLAKKIREVQSHIEKKYGSSESLRRPVHLTLIPPFRRTLNEVKQMEEVLQSFCSSEEAFLVRIDGFDCFERNRVIFLSIRPPGPVASFRQELRDTLEMECALFLEARERKFHPHITVGYRDLYREPFENAWEEFNGMDFRDVWEASTVDLLIHDGEWKPMSVFHLS